METKSLKSTVHYILNFLISLKYISSGNSGLRYHSYLSVRITWLSVCEMCNFSMIIYIYHLYICTFMQRSPLLIWQWHYRLITTYQVYSCHSLPLNPYSNLITLQLLGYIKLIKPFYFSKILENFLISYSLSVYDMGIIGIVKWKSPSGSWRMHDHPTYEYQLLTILVNKVHDRFFQILCYSIYILMTKLVTRTDYDIRKWPRSMFRWALQLIVNVRRYILLWTCMLIMVSSDLVLITNLASWLLMYRKCHLLLLLRILVNTFFSIFHRCFYFYLSCLKPKISIGTSLSFTLYAVVINFGLHH